MGAANDPDRKVEDARRRVRESDLSDDDKEAILRFSRAVDEREREVDGEEKSLRTNATYTDHLRRIAKRTGTPLLDCDTKDVTDVFSAMSNDYASRTLGAYQSAAKAFYRHFDGHEVEVDRIDVDRGDDNAVDTSSLLTEDEFFALREAATNARDRAVVDLLGYTGQRVRAIQTLRVGDVDPHDGATGTYRLNPDDGGLKGAHRSMGRRPLLGAKRAVIELLQNHPTGRSDDYLITCLPSARNGTPGEMLSQSQMRRVIEKLAERSGLDTEDTPVNPHAFRHYFATVAYRDFDMDKGTIKRLLGHADDSRIFETTYRHLDDDDVIAEAESAMGVESDDGGRSCPPMCPDCHAPLKDGTERCGCGTVVADADTVAPSEPRAVEGVIPADEFHDYAGEFMSHMISGFADEAGIDLGDPDEMAERIAAEAAEAVDVRSVRDDDDG